ncbi:cell division protein FtsL [Proteinivorax hydrogeniformans]|uniref:Cell division protein FtsL n=1 Tax=Proteinivorax hydrogeniformans TaxID=1826727 RepID=A0AAU8HPW3_9FIRM
MVAERKKQVYHWGNEKSQTSQVTKNNQGPVHPIFKNAMLILIMVGMSVGVVYGHANLVAMSREVNNLQTQRNQLIDERNSMQIEVARASSLSRVERVAMEELDLVLPQPDEFKVVRHSPEQSN